ncbi:MAG: cysteine hydrolase family protein [Solirubrobacteraceae bacterium]
MSPPNPERRALLLIDFQHDFLDPHGRMPVARGHVEPMVSATRRAITHAQRDGELVVKIGNEFRRGDVFMNALRRRAAIEGSAGAAWDPRVDAAGAPYIPKWKASAFCNPALGQLLDERGVGHVILTGLQAGACVTATAKAALARGLQVSALTPAVACRSDASRDRALGRLARRGVHLLTDLDDCPTAPLQPPVRHPPGPGSPIQA